MLKNESICNIIDNVQQLQVINAGTFVALDATGVEVVRYNNKERVYNAHFEIEPNKSFYWNMSEIYQIVSNKQYLAGNQYIVYKIKQQQSNYRVTLLGQIIPNTEIRQESKVLAGKLVYNETESIENLILLKKLEPHGSDSNPKRKIFYYIGSNEMFPWEWGSTANPNTCEIILNSTNYTIPSDIAMMVAIFCNGNIEGNWNAIKKEWKARFSF